MQDDQNLKEIIPPVNDSPYRRILAIGDVHGQLTKLLSLWKKLNVTDEDLVIFLGDYTLSEDGDDFGTLRWLTEQSRRKNVIALMGNVDYGFTEWVEENDAFDIEQDVLQFLRNLPFSHCIEVGGRKYFFCHAGVNPDKPLDAQRKYQLIGLTSSEKFYSEYTGDAVIVVGHRAPAKIVKKIPRVAKSVRADFDPYKPLKIPCANILMLDTRAKDADGRLSCADILSGQYWQSDAKTKSIDSVLFVCSGNTCRSPMAKYIMRHLLAENGLAGKVVVDSAGCYAHGKRMANLARAVLTGNNILTDEHIPKSFTPQEYKKFQCVIALDREMLLQAKEISGGDPDKKIRLFTDANGKEMNVDDPWGTGDYRKAYREIFKGCSALLKELV